MLKKSLCLPLCLVSTLAWGRPLTGIVQELFGGLPAQSRCVSVRPRSLDQPFTHLDPSLDETIRRIIAAVRDNDAKGLRFLFHPRLRIALKTIEKSLTQQHYGLGAPLEVSVYRLYALASQDHRAVATPCSASDDEDGGIEVFPHYGYDLQFGVWLQLLGKHELGRVYLTLVPQDGAAGWTIGFFHYHKWSHAEKTYQHWFAAAQAAARAQDFPWAYIQADIADKLMAGSDYFQFRQRAQVTKLKDELATRFAWPDAIKNQLAANYPTLAIATVFVDQGVGLLVRRILTKELSSVDLRADCHGIQSFLKQQNPWFKNIQGVRCAYTMTDEDPSKEGRLGSLYIEN